MNVTSLTGQLPWVGSIGRSFSRRSNPLFEVYAWGYERTKDLTPGDIKDFVWNFPEYYEAWWLSLFRESPLHILIETGMIVFIIWLIFIRKTGDPKKASKAKLSIAEQDELIAEWQPEPLVPALTARQEITLKNRVIVEDSSGKYLKLAGLDKPVLNMASFDFLNLANSKAVKADSVAALQKYGCGSCGPRGFYGTIDAHLNFENDIASFLGTEQAISYSDSASAVSSAITAFAKRGDLLLVDEACCEPIRTGVNLSRAQVQYFKHNSISDLRNKLMSVAEDDRKKSRNVLEQRRFIITEGLFRNTGEIVPLPELMQLKEKYCYRLILDESLSFGTLGKTGRGVTEYYNVPIQDVEIILVAMDTTLASVGGVCVGSREIVDHQRLSGPGYCFSAAAPPFLSSAASAALRELKKSPALVAKLEQNAQKLRQGLDNVPGIYLKTRNASDKEVSPVLHYCVDAQEFDVTPEQEKQIIMELCKAATLGGVGITSCKYSINDSTGISPLMPAFRVCANVSLTDAEISTVVSTITKAVENTFSLVLKARKRARTASGDALGNSLLEDEHAMLDLASKTATSPFKNFFSGSQKRK